MGDRMFWGIVIFVFVCLFWLKYLERFLPMWFGAIVAMIVFFAVLAITRPKKVGRRS